MQTSSERKILAAFTAGHIVDDIYMNALPPFLPVLISGMGLSYSSAGLLVTLFTLTSSVSQPFVGYVIDHYRPRWVGPAGLVWVAVFIGLMGLAGSYPVLLVLATLAGLGPAMFHPHALAAVSRLSSGSKGRIMSIFIIGGNIGFAAGPLLIGTLTTSLGRQGMLYAAIPGILMGAWIGSMSGASAIPLGERHPFRLAALRPAVLLITVAILRSWVYFSVLSYLPSFFVQAGRTVLKSNLLLSGMLLAGVGGQYCGGILSDRYGRRKITSLSLMLAAIFLILFLRSGGAPALVCLFCFGFSVMASFSVTMVMMHQLMEKHIGIASGIMIGFALGVGGMGVMVTGLMADRFGLGYALHGLIAVVAAAGLLSRFIPAAADR